MERVSVMGERKCDMGERKGDTRERKCDMGEGWLDEVKPSRTNGGFGDTAIH